MARTAILVGVGDQTPLSRDSPWGTFRSDLGASLAVWSTEPRLPLLTLALALAIEISTAVARQPEHRILYLLVFSLEVPLAGWVGTQRIWYLRAFRGKTMGRGEAGRFTWAFLGRYLVLGLFVEVVVSPLVLVRPTGWLVYLALVLILVDIFLTFVTPALAYSTKSTTKALRIGWRLLRQDWPHCAWYALTPPLALNLITRSLPRSSLAVVPAAVIGTVTWMLRLWFKGATAAYYLRDHDVGDDGAACFR